MPVKEPPQSGIILHQTEVRHTRIQCRFEDETIWLTQAQIAALFHIFPQNVTLHLKAIYKAGELKELATCNHFQLKEDERSGERSDISPSPRLRASA